MSNQDSVEDQQRNELEALKAIYDKDLVDLSKQSAWNKWSPLDILIKLTPLRGSSGLTEENAKLNLHLICPVNYPNKTPKIILENTTGMSKETLTELQIKLEKKADILLGEVMIFQLCEEVKEFLYEHNKPAPISFYEEMVLRKHQQEMKEIEAQQLIEALQTKKVREEILEREEILKMENKRIKESKMISETSNNGVSLHRRTSVRNSGDSNESSDEILQCAHLNTKSILFVNNGEICIIRGRCINHSDRKCIIYSGMDNKTGQLYILSEWKLPANCDKQISSIEQELNYLVKLKHPNLARYLNSFHEKDALESKSVLHILQDFVFGLNCSQLYISENIPAENNILRHIAEGVLNALDFLHRNNVVHKNISSSCVYIDRKGRIKLSNYSLDKRLSDLLSQSQSSNFSKKLDIYRFGLFVLCLVKGANVDEEHFEIPINISPELYDFLSNCLCLEDKSRYTAAQLLNHKFLKVPLVRFTPFKNGNEKIPERAGSPEVQTDIQILAHHMSNGQSRVDKEFEMLDHLGSGAYGDVYKVRNILDQRYYALKRIKLNPRNRQLNKKIIREVKLLSRLNHENVVRYYNSWIETAVFKSDNLDSATSYSTSKTTLSIESLNKKVDSANYSSSIEKLAPPVDIDMDWSISYGNDIPKDGCFDDSNNESDEDDDNENWGLHLSENSSDSILFQNESECVLSKSNKSVDNGVVNKVETRIKEIQYMYIQMEFCDKSTLRTAIDNNLYLDTNRVWRLFREIVEGLAHIHQQGMIHRDLKPMNIFIDYNDHVKIGDFGLATTSLLTRTNETFATNKSYLDNQSSQEQTVDPSMTGHVGTALYVAPEITSTAKAVYNQKVDIYSLGIIFFEMCYNPLKTGMEKINIISGLRSEKISFPPDFSDKVFGNQEYIINWLLDHNVSQRPTSQELLESENIPPPVLEERELRELVRHTLSNPQLKAYKYLVESCFKQQFTAAQDITYDRDVSLANTVKNIPLYNYVKEIIIRVFKLHGGQYVSTPLLMPKSKYYDSIDTCVKLMTHSGYVVSVPYDLRVPFARYVAWNEITSLRRYSIEKVYREKKVFGFLPRELYECAFDIVSPSPGNFMADAELLYILNEIINEITALNNRNFLIRLNHSLLLKAIFMHCGIKENMHKELYAVLSEAKEGKITQLEVRTHLINKGLSNNSIGTLFNLMESEGTINKITSQLQTITKKKNTDASTYAKQALHELKIILTNAEALGVSFNIIVSLGLVYNVQQYSGMMFQLVCEVRKKKKIAMDVLAAGGRYDNMIRTYRNTVVQDNESSMDIKQSAVGVSISLDKLTSAMQKNQDDMTNFAYLDVAVCSLGTNAFIKEKSKVLKDLWCAGIRCTLIDASTLEEIQEQCNELKVPHVIILKDSEVKIKSWDRERFFEKKATIGDLVENMQRILKIGNDTCPDSRVYHNEQEINVNINFLTSEKLLANNRKRLENQIRSQMDSLFKRLNGSVCVLVINLEIAVIKTMVAFLDFESESVFNKSVEEVKEKHLRHKKYLHEICPEIFEEKSKRANPVIVLYSYNDNLFKA
ncbi:PREDICTED: eIF-2-alpha kinase GCN2 [Nicrophorus vespilloides]|uniref:non-specific serine/threonine protein kinase n=1 Tax=Nicrophorus vespilloides TaxID=110193 RepID=A0ABM1NAZ2_NICVS|nr:PREDICTED: eIF-2-alpha kinase GCN2 [Nicrophorus vespilloides]